jgi:hypothetical protein
MMTIMGGSDALDHMEVVDARGLRVGTVDHLEGDRIKLTRDDSPDNMHHFISTTLVASVDQKVHLSKSRDEVQNQWTDG